MARESGEPIVLAVDGALVKENEVMCGPLKGALLDTFGGSVEVKQGLRGLCYRGLVSSMAHRYHHRGVHSRK